MYLFFYFQWGDLYFQKVQKWRSFGEWRKFWRMAKVLANGENIFKLEGTPRAQTSVKAAHQSPHIFVTPESFGP